jgi:hypothetical protein
LPHALRSSSTGSISSGHPSFSSPSSFIGEIASADNCVKVKVQLGRTQLPCHASAAAASPFWKCLYL